MRRKLGLQDAGGGDDVDVLVDELVSVMQQSRVDHTSFFRSLSGVVRGNAEPARGAVLDLGAFDAWVQRWLALDPDAGLMDRVNPVYIPRNHLVEEALAAGSDGDVAPLERLLEAVTDPYRGRPGLERYAEPAPTDFGPYRTFCGT